ncbi:hypothetical protein [Glaciihabitans sp. UYNi722]|uniref:hypothetical protein n=1 Tax=Glaciihabitans sp. UYNi722 TaxID=3156344 RepID=UPI0033950833
MKRATRTRQPADAIEIVALSNGEWRVCDSRLPNDDARRVLGFIESKNGAYEVFQLGRAFEWFVFDSLAEATAHFTGVSAKQVRPEEHVLSWTRSAR